MECYKVIGPNLVSPFKRFRFDIGKEYVCDDFDDNPEVDCSMGFYATPAIEGCLYSGLNRGDIYLCESIGRTVECDPIFKIRHEGLKIVRALKEDEIRAIARTEGEDRGYNIEESLYPIHPLKIKRSDICPTKEELKALAVGDSVWASVWASVGDSVGASVGAYIGSLFPGAFETPYKYQPLVDLWKAGLVPSYDGKRWRLHSGENAKIIWEGKL
jgi:hypothetical protein